MTDTFGGITTPVSTTDDPVGDPALAKLGGFLQAVLNSVAGPAWAAVQPTPTSDELPLVKRVITHSPADFGCNDNDLPALFVWRPSGKTRLGTEWIESDDIISIAWIPSPQVAEKQRARFPFANAVAKVALAALYNYQDPNWADLGDPWPFAASQPDDDDAILTTKATSLSPIVYSGAGLDGDLGAAPLAPPRNISLTLGLAFGAYSGALTIVYLDPLGRSATWVHALPANGGVTVSVGVDVKQIVSISIPAQSSTAGSIRVGALAFRGRGSSVMDRCGFAIILPDRWSAKPIKLELDGDQDATNRLPHMMVQIDITVAEVSDRDLSLLPPSQIDLAVTNATA